MATRSLSRMETPAKDPETLMTFDEAMRLLAQDERFRATVYAMNTLLVQKGIYSPEEFEFHFRQWAQKHRRAH